MPAIHIADGVRIPEDEIELRFARSGGPGGAKADTSSTKVQLRFDVETSRALTDEQKARVRHRLDNRITNDGVLLLASSEYRTQQRNRKGLLARFRNLLTDALEPTRQRKSTRPPRAANERRLAQKRRRSEKKRLRKDPELPPDYR